MGTDICAFNGSGFSESRGATRSRSQGPGKDRESLFEREEALRSESLEVPRGLAGLKMAEMTDRVSLPLRPSMVNHTPTTRRAKDATVH